MLQHIGLNSVTPPPCHTTLESQKDCKMYVIIKINFFNFPYKTKGV